MTTATITEAKTAKAPAAKPARKAAPKRAPKASEPKATPSTTPEATASSASVTGTAAATVESPTDKAKRYADASIASQVADRLTKAKEAGWTRPALMQLTGMTASAVWRAQNGKVHPGEVESLTAVLTKIEAGELKPPTTSKPKRAAKNVKCVQTLEAALQEKTLAATRKLVTEALEALRSPSA
ncbi:hypothetical protein [Lentzea flaviverrucosa]|uniref:Helix-turn-helix n=1 Tax=Lentzea flaviverrucosa TaxID=200379 RepID=A0A1H9XA79_9PSEU|nr:hypothetical protein [Lentzea flaviverrucosa]RDI21697.1 hypothetical protein DFR72_113244 [Lentzea flaviverrucosa]SES43080.1 hypothetical protein SAMN05216195_11436 [Lentzea flaviverrucosa]